jgi:Ca2+-binding EF-hand superfamily protein
MARHLDDATAEDLRDMFTTIDVNGDGTLTFDEMRLGLQKAGMTDLVEDMLETMRIVDTDGSGVIDYSEFLAATLGRKVYTDYNRLWQVFKQFDRKGIGEITKDDLALILSGGTAKTFESCGHNRSEIEQLIAKYDLDGNGTIDFDEFIALMGGKAQSTMVKLHRSISEESADNLTTNQVKRERLICITGTKTLNRHLAKTMATSLGEPQKKSSWWRPSTWSLWCEADSPLFVSV